MSPSVAKLITTTPIRFEFLFGAHQLGEGLCCAFHEPLFFFCFGRKTRPRQGLYGSNHRTVGSRDMQTSLGRLAPTRSDQGSEVGGRGGWGGQSNAQSSCHRASPKLTFPTNDDLIRNETAMCSQQFADPDRHGTWSRRAGAESTREPTAANE